MGYLLNGLGTLLFLLGNRYGENRQRQFHSTCNVLTSKLKEDDTLSFELSNRILWKKKLV